MNSLLQTLFPGCTEGRGGSEANGLAKGSVPQNCDILDQFDHKYYTGEGVRRTHFLVATGVFLVHLRICAAMEGSGYDEFAVICKHTPFENEKQAIRDQWESWKDSFTK